MTLIFLAGWFASLVVGILTSLAFGPAVGVVALFARIIVDVVPSGKRYELRNLAVDQRRPLQHSAAYLDTRTARLIYEWLRPHVLVR